MSHCHKLHQLFWLLVAGLSMLFSSGCCAEFFVDKGHVDTVEGISFEIKTPYLSEKKAFKLREENLSAWQLQQISEAMPVIAAFTHAQLGNAISASGLNAPNLNVRNIREIQHLNSDTFLAVKTIQNWQLTTQQIQFNIDYFYAGQDGRFVYFRDNYIFSASNRGWAFEKHARAEPEGVLACERNPSGWLVCKPRKPVN